MSARAESIRELASSVHLPDVAELLLGLDRPGGAGNFRSPRHGDRHASLSVYQAADGTWRWKDHSTDEGGDAVDLIAYVRGCSKGAAIRELRDFTGLRRSPPASAEPARQESLEEHIAAKCLAGDLSLATDYLETERGIPRELAERAVRAKVLGFNTWRSPKVPAGQAGHGGPAVAFIVRGADGRGVEAVDLRYLDAETNGGQKTATHGRKNGAPWLADPRALADAEQVVLVESPINALSVQAAGLRRTVAVAIRGTGNAEHLPLAPLAGKRVILCMDADRPDERGRCAGMEAAWRLHERLTTAGVACLLVDTGEWPEKGWNDVNDVLKQAGAEELARRLQAIEPWLVPGLPAQTSEALRGARRRLWLPAEDLKAYWRFRVRWDFTAAANGRRDDDGNELLDDVAGFRVAVLSRVTVQGATATMSGDVDAQPRVLFAASVQVPRHGPRLVRRVFEDEHLHNVETWRRFGPVFKPAQFARMLSILERGADIGEARAVNFVGLAWRDGRPVVNEGPDCYFIDPRKQCPYHALQFPRGSREDARRVLQAYAHTFTHHAASILLCWALGAHLKAFLGFWPHMVLQADKGAGKSTLVKRLERTIAFTMFSGQSLQTDFRLLTSIAHTSHPVGWEELSARAQKIIDAAVAMLQEAYQWTTNRRSSDMLEYVLAAPVLLAGEDVPVRSLLGKVVRTELTGRKGEQLDEDLPRFPVREWLEHLAGMERATVRERYRTAVERLRGACSAARQDDGASRMVGNYAAVLLAAELLAEFAEVQPTGSFAADLVATMNAHIRETSAEREPWVWLMEMLLSEIAAGRFRFPFVFDFVDEPKTGVRRSCLLFRPAHVLDHLAREPGLRDRWNSSPVKSPKVFKRQLLAAQAPDEDGGMRRVVVKEKLDRFPPERDAMGRPVRDSMGGVIRAPRAQDLVAVDLESLRLLGLEPDDPARGGPEGAHAE